MSRIHHTQHQKAQKLGVQLEESGQFIRAIWPMRNIAVFGVDARWAIEQMEATQRLVRYAEDRGSELSVRTNIAQPTMVHLIIDGEPTKESNAPMVWWNQVDKLGFLSGVGEPKVAIKVVGPQGEPIDEDPSEDEIEQPRAQDTEEEALPAKSVVKPKYRASYAERGTPTTCNDELAQKLNNLIHNKGGTNIEMMDMLAEINDVDLSKYSRTSPGWQGRLRMTFRNMLQKKLKENGGVLKVPEGWTQSTELRMSQEWLSG